MMKQPQRYTGREEPLPGRRGRWVDCSQASGIDTESAEWKAKRAEHNRLALERANRRAEALKAL